MDVADKIQEKLNKILKKLKSLGVIQAFKLEITFSPLKKSLKRSLVEIDTILKKCVKKITRKPKKAEIRNVISELVQKKNSNGTAVAHGSVTETPIEGKCFPVEYPMDGTAVATAEFIFQCGFCNEEFNSRKSFSIHKKIHKHSEGYLCEKCGQIFYKHKRWQQHMEGCSKKSVLLESHELDFGNEILTGGGNEPQMNTIPYENLITQPHFEEKRENSCPKYKSENQVVEKKEEKFICACGKSFNFLKTFRKHEKLKHSPENIKYNCLTCGKSFLERGKLNRHMLSHKESQHQCSFCPKRFSRSDTLKRHASLFHYTSREFLCRFCKKKFKLKFNRDVHEENIHKNLDTWVKCQLCGQRFRNKITLKSHLKIHSDSRITCTLCNKSFSRKTYYRSHMENKHSGTVTS